MKKVSSQAVNENIQVSVRVRPLNSKEISKGDVSAWRIDGNTISLDSSSGAQASQFTFDHIFSTDATTFDLYRIQAAPIVSSVMEGINGTVLAYGQTSSGKTFTMQGDQEHPGIISMAIKDVFDYIKNTPDREFLLRVSYLEIYNEIIRDLLNPESNNLKIKIDPQNGSYVGGLQEEIVLSPQKIEELMDAGDLSRHVGVTDMNERSSRSHTIFRLIVESRERLVQGKTEEEIDGGIRVATLSLVDLAGSERASATANHSSRFKEGMYINKSLLTLGTVMSKLANGNPSHVPYRDSKLTHILEPSLGGNTRTAMICTVTPANFHYETTLSTLKFANRAKTIQNAVKKNEIVDDQTLIKRLKKEIDHLRLRLRRSESIQKVSSDETCGEYDTKLDNLRKLFLQSQSLCDYKIPTSGPTTNKQAQRRITIHSTKFDSNINDIQKNQLPSFSIFSGAPLFEKPMFKKKSLSSSENSNTNSLEHQEDNLRSVFKLVASEAAAQGMKKALLTDKNTEIARQQVTQKKLEAQTIELEERLMGIHQENEKLLSEMVLLREQNSEYRLKVESMQGLQAFMTTCPSDPKSLKESLYSAKQEIDKLKSEVKGLIKEKKMMETKLKERDNLEKNLAELKGKFKDLRHERNLIENSTKNDKKLIDSLKSKLNSFEESKQSALDEKEEELTNLKQSRAAEEEATKIQLQKLVSENNVANNRISELSLELSGIREKCTENEKSLSAANSTISDLNSTIRVLTEERDAANQKVEELKSIIQDADAKQVSIHFEFMQKEQKIEVEKQQLVSKLQVVESELQKLRCENQTLTSDCRAHSEELQKSLVTIEELQSMKRDSVDNLGALERENQILLQKLTAEENQCRELQCLKTEFEQKFEKLESEKIESIRALSSESSKNEQLQKNFNSLKNSLIELKAGIVSAEEKSEVLEAANKDNELCIAELNRKLDGANRERRACIDFLNRILQGEDLATESSDGDEVSLLSKLQDLEARFSEIKMQVNNVVSRSGMENDSENVGNRSNKDEADQELDAEEKFASLKKGMDSRTERKLIKYMHQYADAKLKEIRKENQHLKEVIKSLQK